MIKIYVNGSVVSVQETEALYSGSADVHTCHFEFDTDWESFAKTAVFRVGEKAVTALVNDENACVLPWELLTRSNIGFDIEVGVYGVSAEAEVMTSVWDTIGPVREGTELGNDAREPSAGIYEQITASVKKIDDKVVSYNEQAQTQVQRAESAATVAKASADSAAQDAESAATYASALKSELAGIKNALDNIPEGDTVIVNDLTTGGAGFALSAEMGSVLGKRPNPQLLINADFTNVVNQRGKTEYTANGYTVDCWRSSYANTRVTPGKDGITFAAEADASRYVQQFIEYPGRLYGRTVTMSALVEFGDETKKEIVLVSDTKTVPTAPEKTQVCSLSFTPSISSGLHMRADGRLLVQFGIKSGASYKVKAAKLEVGDAQTLAHQDGAGNWVLNEVSDYAAELRKCQRYFQVVNIRGIQQAHLLDVYGNGDNSATGTLQLSTSMRTIPAVTMSGLVPDVWLSYSEGEMMHLKQCSITGISVSADTGDLDRLRIKMTTDDPECSFESGKRYEINAPMSGNVGATTQIYLDANL